ncbi:hypothetical protein [Variovorax sp. LT1R16]|uniref:hypothetical protein n=1 Tax=Variovorax sp. LT1R16 TaxID=3443728 RepID=UPI003F48CFE0
MEDHLPTLNVLRQAKRRFELVLLTAVWMHLDLLERERIFGLETSGAEFRSAGSVER